MLSLFCDILVDADSNCCCTEKWLSWQVTLRTCCLCWPSPDPPVTGPVTTLVSRGWLSTWDDRIYFGMNSSSDYLADSRTGPMETVQGAVFDCCWNVDPSMDSFTHSKLYKSASIVILCGFPCLPNYPIVMLHTGNVCLNLIDPLPKFQCTLCTVYRDLFGNISNHGRGGGSCVISSRYSWSQSPALHRVTITIQAARRERSQDFYLFTCTFYPFQIGQYVG